jgi:hypothetical protein
MPDVSDEQQADVAVDADDPEIEPGERRDRKLVGTC